MANKLYDENSVQAIADAIRSKNGRTTVYKISQMAEAITSLSTGGVDFADSIDELNKTGDKSKRYVLPDGYIYEWKTSTTQETVTTTDNIQGTTDNPYIDNARLSSAQADTFNTDVTGYFVSPLIDLNPYAGKQITLHLEGAQYFGKDSGINYVQSRFLGKTKNIVMGRDASIINGTGHAWNGITNATITYVNDTNVKIEFSNIPALYSSVHTEVWYLRFGAKGVSSSSNIYITYESVQQVTKEQWTNTGIKYSSSADLEEKVSKLNNEGTDTLLFTQLSPAVLAFYNSAVYDSNDYSYTNVQRAYLPYRADIPLPATLKWPHNQDASRTIVSLNTLSNIFSAGLKWYDATGLDRYPIYNLLPNTKYYYSITHLMPDGITIEAKNGSFTTGQESWRLIKIDGIQNVRDLGGWSGLNGKKVKYGKLFRGSALEDSTFRDLILTDEGRNSLITDLGIRAELDLRYGYSKSDITSDIAYKVIGYSQYATAFTTDPYKGYFKDAFEWIIAQLQANKPIYFHCQGGCDRTGTLSFQLLGLLGVSESDLAKEYELSSFSPIGQWDRLRNSTIYGYSAMINEVKKLGGATIADKMVSFATEVGITQNQIDTFRNLMLS